jgi:hypothetical protein
MGLASRNSRANSARSGHGKHSAGVVWLQWNRLWVIVYVVWGSTYLGHSELRWRTLPGPFCCRRESRFVGGAGAILAMIARHSRRLRRSP